MDDPTPDWQQELADDPDFRALSAAERERLIAVMERMLEMGVCAVYGDEAEDGPDSCWDCRPYLDGCRARCCTFTFALTKDEVERGTIRHNPSRPFFIARDADGYCPHLDRATLRCLVWEQRPLRCRRYDCQGDTNVWPDGVPRP
jgi:hypothetical protein